MSSYITALNSQPKSSQEENVPKPSGKRGRPPKKNKVEEKIETKKKTKNEKPEMPSKKQQKLTKTEDSESEIDEDVEFVKMESKEVVLLNQISEKISNLEARIEKRCVEQRVSDMTDQIQEMKHLLSSQNINSFAAQLQNLSQQVAMIQYHQQPQQPAPVRYAAPLMQQPQQPSVSTLLQQLVSALQHQ